MRPKEYIHVARQRAGAFRFKPRVSPKMAAVGDAPHQGQSQSPAAPPCQPERLARPGPSHLLGQHRMAARELGQLFQFVQLSPKAAKPRGYFGPTPDTSASPGERSCSQRVQWAGLRQASCANCWPSASSYPMAHLPGGKCGLGGQAGQVHGACVPTAPK